MELTPTEPTRQLMTPGEACAYLRCAHVTLLARVRAGYIPCYQPAGPKGHRRYRVEDLDAFLARCYNGRTLR